VQFLDDGSASKLDREWLVDPWMCLEFFDRRSLASVVRKHLKDQVLEVIREVVASNFLPIGFKLVIQNKVVEILILFIIVQGIFPFKEAKKEEYFYNLILNNKLETYWKKVGGNNLSDDFKDLILKMFSYDGSKRPTIDELKAHPWINKPFSVKLTRASIMEKLADKRSEKTTHMSKDDDKTYRGGSLEELVR
jgi:serine/threonine protein kinase